MSVGRCAKTHFTGPLLLVVSLLAGCSGDTDPHALVAPAERARELELLRAVDIVQMSREQFAQQAAERAAAIDERALREYAETYGRLGYFDVSLDLVPIIGGSSSDWVGATYSPSTKRVTLVGDARDDIVVHELVHALQDQHFDLGRYDSYETSDAYLARRAVVEGDAVLAQYRFMVQSEDKDLDAVDWLELFDAWRGYSYETLATSEYPVVFLDYVSFVYAYGFELAAANLLGVTYELVEASGEYAPAPPPYDLGLADALFRERPPATAQQVLGRDVDGSKSDAVLAVGLSEVPAALGDRLQAIDWDTLGQWYVYLLLFPVQQAGGVTDALSLAGAWDGDRVLFARDLTTQEVAAAWTSVWDTEADAQAVLAAMAELYGVAVVTPGSVARAADGEPVWLERRGQVIVVIKNLAEELMPALAQAAFGAQPTARAPKKRRSLPALLHRLRDELPCVHLAY